MDLEMQRHLFEPFFTTKDKSKGTGLGLPTVYGIVKQHGGDIEVSSRPGSGTTVSVYLPIATETAQGKNAATSPVAHDAKSQETVLVVEDEAVVRKLITTILNLNGYNVIDTGDPREALQRAKEMSKPIDLLVTDIVMPHMNGRQVHEQLAAVFPNMKTLYVSGYTENIIAHHGVLEEGVQFLQKPFSAYDLLHKVRTIFEN